VPKAELKPEEAPSTLDKVTNSLKSLVRIKKIGDATADFSLTKQALETALKQNNAAQLIKNWLILPAQSRESYPAFEKEANQLESHVTSLKQALGALLQSLEQKN
jgi:hypothetical protein